MISTFNQVRLQSLLKDFYTLAQIRITVFNENFEEIVSYPREPADFCRIIRSDPYAKEQCMKCDREACSMASQQRTTHIYRCHTGLTEAITPILMGNIVIGYLFFGHVFSYPLHEIGWDNIQKLSKPYQVDRKALENACYECPIIPENYISSASNLLRAVAAYLCMEQMAVLKQDSLPVQIDRYLAERFTEEISAKDVCDHFQIGKTHLYEISKQSYGVGIAEHIRRMRIEKAKSLLSGDSDLRISDVASSCGFNDYNYFITLFKRVAGLSPKQYQRSCSGSSPQA